ncbi:hypothetical protein SMD22_00215 (plasmid) [Brevibacillus halotolerans]|nr:hypothetical protein SMD22_00215 [Brevibacillus halotolerans]
MSRFVLVRTDTNHAVFATSREEVIYHIENYKKNGSNSCALPFQIFDLGNQLSLNHFIQESAKVGDVVRFKTGVVCRVVPNGEAELSVDVDKITVSDVAFYFDSGSCVIVPEELYIQPNGTLRMEIPTDNLQGCCCLRYEYYAVCNERPDCLVFGSGKELYQIDDNFNKQDFDPKHYIGNTWTLKKRAPVQKKIG